MAMCHGDRVGAVEVVLEHEPDEVGKHPHGSTSHRAMHRAIEHRRVVDARHRGVDLVEQTITQAGGAGVVPGQRSGDVALG